ncbi:MAG: hypothetical protein KUG82_12945 [Pseudomonadales bacterium]|nr:hypothetical protein [Pseudomonadales bacterium]
MTTNNYNNHNNKEVITEPNTVGQIYRKVSPLERTYLYHDRGSEQPMILNAVLEGHGEFHLQQWQAALNKVAIAYPGIRLKKSGRLGFSNWRISGSHIPVTLIENSLWDGMSPENAVFLRNPLSPYEGPNFEVVLVKSDKLRVIFRLHHAVGDTGAMRHIIDDVFRVLKGGEAIGSNSVLCDFDILSRIPRSRLPKSTNTDIAPTGLPQGSSMNSLWHRIQLPLKEYKLLPKMMIAIRQATDTLLKDRSPQEDMRIRLTVDMRRHLPKDTRTTANCSGAFDVCVSSDDSPKNIVRKMSASLRSNSEAACPPPYLLALTRWAPTMLLGVKDKTLLKLHETAQYPRSGTLSMVPKGVKSDYCAAGFIGETSFAIPPPLKLLPFFMTLWVHEDEVEMVVGMPELLGNNGRLEQFTKQVRDIATKL